LSKKLNPSIGEVKRLYVKPVVVSVVAGSCIRFAVRGTGACVLARKHPRGQVASGLVQLVRGLGVSGGPRYRDQPGLAPSAIAF